LCFVSAFTARRARSALWAGIWFALAVLTRPGPDYFVVCAVLAIAVVGIACGRRQTTLRALVFALGFCAVLAPWSARNLSHFSSPALTASYGGYILAQRVIYNRMSWPEWGVAFIYWLPDFGDSLARDMYDPKYYEKLGFGPGTYYAEEAPRYYQEVVAAAGSVNAVAGYLLRHAVIGDPVKHTLVSLPLAVRALFPGRFCGLLGFASVLAVLVATLRRAAGTCSSGPAGNIHGGVLRRCIGQHPTLQHHPNSRLCISTRVVSGATSERGTRRA
jgi:hypothetical protein